MKKVIPILIVVVVLLCAFGGYFIKAFNKPVKENTDSKFATVSKGDLISSVIETGTIDAVKTVEVKSRVSGRLAHLYVDAGDMVKEGQLIAIIDPLETKLLVEQNRAQLHGAQSSVEKQALEIQQRKLTARAAYEQSKQRLIQLEAENRIQPTLTRNNIQQAQTAYNAAVQERDRIENSVQPNTRVSSQSNLHEAEANYELAQADLNRQQELLSKGYTSEKVVQSAKQQVEVAKARLESAKDSMNRLDSQLSLELAKANEQVKQTAAALNSAKANQIQDVTKRQDFLSAAQDVEKARAALQDIAIMEKGKDQSKSTVDQLSSVVNDAERQLRETEIRAPISGIVSKRLMQEGELVASLSSFSSGSPIVDIEDRTQMRVKLDVNEIDVAKMNLNMDSEITVDALPEKKMHGVIKKISPSSNAATGATDPVVKYQVEIYITDAVPELKTGMSAKCSMEVLHKKGVLQLPVDFVGKDGEKHFVQIPPANAKDPKAKSEKKTVTTGAETATSMEILSGVAEGTKVERPEYKGPERKGMMQMGGDGG